MSEKSPPHPGPHIREFVLPRGMKVIEAAKLLDVGRPALSNLLNGKADLSAEMAAKLERAFGVSSRSLLDMQSAYDSEKARGRGAGASARPYVPPFLQLRAKAIEEWAGSGIAPRQRLAVFLRILINSTGADLSLVNFPGNDDSERAGWDGEVENGQATPWIPEGKSGWEFGVNQDPKSKADGDYAKSVAATDTATMKETTFVFVTPRRWAGKGDWVKAKRSEKRWRDVRAYDASDLEQWLEQTISGQVWFANETGRDSQGAISLDTASAEWAADCEPPLSPQLFEGAIEANRLVISNKLVTEPYEPLVISADSRDEAVAFLSAVFSAEDRQFGAYRDRVVLFRDPATMTKVAAQVSNIIPVIASNEVERAFAPSRSKMPAFIIYPRNATNAEPDIVLETLNSEAFSKALEGMGLNRDRIDKLSRESGRSPTVLRRRLSKLRSIQTPDWAADTNLARSLIPLLMAGAWKSDAEVDKFVVSAFANDRSFEDIQSDFAALAKVDGSPVWQAGSFQGVVSKIDILFAISRDITAADIDRFFEVAWIVLSEGDPALELPDEDRWKAAIYGKTRQISGALRAGIAETLVLLAVYGPTLFKDQLTATPALRANRLIRELLTPLTGKKLESQVDNLCLYAEAAPEEFLKILEHDLQQEDSATLSLIRPVSSSPFGGTPRTGLLWALESLAWVPERLMRTVLVLARLAEQPLDDNLANKPSASLASIFRAWMPQTTASLEQRKAALELLAQRFPSVAWPILVDQFSHGTRIGGYSSKPRWRPDGHGSGSPVTRGEANDFALKAFELAMDWPLHTRQTVGDLVGNLDGLADELRERVWDLVDRWSADATEDDRADLREQIRVSALTRRVARHRARKGTRTFDARAVAAYNALEPTSPILRYEWLFRDDWVDESSDEFWDEDQDYRKREERIREQRTGALREIVADGGIGRVIELAERGKTATRIGWLLPDVLEDEQALIDATLQLAGDGPTTGSVQSAILSGLLHRLGDREASFVEVVGKQLSPSTLQLLLRLSPFQRRTWDLVEQLGEKASDSYWREVVPNHVDEADDLLIAIDRLLSVSRPRAAFALARFKRKELPAKVIFRMLGAVARPSADASGTYMLDRHWIREAFEFLNASGAISVEEMAGLEFQFIDVFDRDEHRLTNLEKQIAVHPEMFVQAVALAYKRKDDGEDPEELRARGPENAQALAVAGYHLLERLALIPGDKDGKIDAKALAAWVAKVRSGCAESSRAAIGDICLGKLLSRAPVDEDGAWPCRPVRDVLEAVLNEDIEAGISTALFNARGIHSRGEGGGAERTIAARYGGWAAIMEYKHPRVARMLREMEKRYLQDAEWEDTEAIVRRRLRY